MESKPRQSGFASMNTSQQREIARKGGKAAHRKGTAHEFTSAEARNAGRKGGERVSANRAHMAEIGRLGGKKSAASRKLKKNLPMQPVMAEVSPEADESGISPQQSAAGNPSAENRQVEAQENNQDLEESRDQDAA